MLNSRYLYSSKFSRKVWLYYVVFAGRLSVFLVLTLCFSFLIQPIDQALASDEETAEEEIVVVPDDVELQDDEVESDEVREDLNSLSEDETEQAALDESDTNQSNDEVINDTVSGEETDSNLATSSSTGEDLPDGLDDVENNSSSSVDSNGLNSSSTAATTSETENNTDSLSNEATSASSTDTNATSTAEVGSVDNAGSDSSGDSADESIDAADNESESDTETGTDSTEDNSSTESDIVDGASNINEEQSRLLITEDNYYQFSKQSCALVGDGTYHCSTRTDNPINNQSLVYAERDEDGDMEIYLKTNNGNVRQITDNELEDTAPHFDAESMRLVWQRLIDGRYQIISYDLAEDEEKQLTFSRTNNMEPKVSVEGFVWQAWDGNDWEIMFFDGNYTDQITNNDSQDVGPVIEDGYILWTILGSDEQEARVYSIASGETLTITGHDGGEIANPRFVLVYDTRFDNGDIITKGFDPTTGLSAPISAKPAPEPIDIPETDTTGEIRALIQNKSSQKEQDIVSAPATGPNDSSASSSSASSTDTLDLTTSNEVLEIETDAPTTTEVSEDFELTEYDLVITPDATSSQPSTNEEVILEVSKNASSTQ